MKIFVVIIALVLVTYLIFFIVKKIREPKEKEESLEEFKKRLFETLKKRLRAFPFGKKNN